MKWTYYILAFLIGLNSYAQQSTEFKKYLEEHPDSHSVRLNQETKITIGLEKGSFVIIEETTEEDLFLDESATYKSEQSLNFSTFYEMEKIEASSFVFQNGKYEEIKVTDFKEKDELNDSFYDDTKSLNFIYPNLKKGAKTKLKYSQKIKNPRFLSAFYFGNFYPIVNNKLTIVADKNIKLIFKEINTEKFPISFTKKENRKNTVYTWEVKNIDAFESESNSTNFRNRLPHIIPIITSYEYKGEKKKVLGQVSDLYSWYYSLVENINKEDEEKELVALVNSITKNKVNDLEKARAIYYWTQENIKYIAFEYALGGFIPREANDVFKKKYGDCKDNSSILMEMLEIAGIKGNLTWIGTRSIPYSYDQVPTPMVDNHMILSFEYNGDTYFLDATGRYTSIELPTSFIQGKDALVARGKDSFDIKVVPIIPAKQNTFNDQTIIELEGNDLKGQATAEVSGYLKIDYYYDLERKNSEEKIKEYYNATLEKGNNSFLIEKFNEVNKFEYDKNLIVDYNFKVSNHAKAIGKEIYINLNLNQDLRDLKTKENRKTAIEHDYKNSYTYRTTFKIPEGYSVTYIPENLSVSNAYISSDIKYALKNNEIHYQHAIVLDALTLDLKAQKSVNELIRQIEKGYKEVVVLEKK